MMASSFDKEGGGGEPCLPPDMHTCVCVSGGKKCSFSENIVDVLNK